MTKTLQMWQLYTIMAITAVILVVYIKAHIFSKETNNTIKEQILLENAKMDNIETDFLDSKYIDQIRLEIILENACEYIEGKKKNDNVKNKKFYDNLLMHISNGLSQIEEGILEVNFLLEEVEKVINNNLDKENKLGINFDNLHGWYTNNEYKKLNEFLNIKGKTKEEIRYIYFLKIFALLSFPLKKQSRYNENVLNFSKLNYREFKFEKYIFRDVTFKMFYEENIFILKEIFNKAGD